MTFKPMLAPNQQIDPSQLTYPLLASYKIDGIRVVVDGRGVRTRSLKPVQNIHIRRGFEEVVDMCRKWGMLFDGELYSRNVPFSQFSGIVRSFSQPIPPGMKYYVFDSLYNWDVKTPFEQRCARLGGVFAQHPNIVPIPQVVVDSAEKVEGMMETAIDWGCDGLILRHPLSRYKYGRGTLREGLIFKYKPYRTWESRVIGVHAATVVREDAERKVNELGYSVTSKKKGDRVPIEMASAFRVRVGGREAKVTIAASDDTKRWLWEVRRRLVRRWIEWKGMTAGTREGELPRHPVFIRFRPDLDDDRAIGGGE